MVKGGVTNCQFFLHKLSVFGKMGQFLVQKGMIGGYGTVFAT